MYWISISIPLYFTVFLSTILASPIKIEAVPTTPNVKLPNGTISGKFLSSFNQDAYLGIPYAEPPVGDLRFKPPIAHKSTWKDVKPFTNYGDSCLAVGGTDSANLKQSEDCLTLNVVKPHGDNYKNLPVAIWIHGGSFTDGASSVPTYNASWIVENSVKLGKPIIVVTINYRLNGFGFISSKEFFDQGLTNIGLRDQIKAVEWVHENIGTFNGNPDHLVLWGESAGGKSVGRLLNNNKYLGPYIKGGILESGANVFVNVPNGVTQTNQDDFNKVLKYVNCDGANDKLKCLQDAKAEDLHKAFDTSNKIVSKGFRFPVIDGDVVPASGYDTVKSGKTTWNVPLLIGTNTDEGSIFTDTSLETLDQSKNYLKNLFSNLKQASVDDLFKQYPDQSGTTTPIEPNWTKDPIKYPDSIGAQYKTLATLNSDVLYIAASKITAIAYADHNQPVYKYRFNVPNVETNGADNYKGSYHGKEVPFVFNNKILLSKSNEVNPNILKIADVMSKLWISFIHDLTPNPKVSDPAFPLKVPNWPLYKDNHDQFVIGLNELSSEVDTHRNNQFQLIEKIIHQLDG